MEKIGERIWNTLLLNLVATIIIFSLAIPLGVFSAKRQYSFLDNLGTFGAYLGISAPSFWLAYLLILGTVELFGYPVLGMRSFVTEDFTTTEIVMDRIWHLMLPSIILAIGGIAGLSRYTRSSMLEVVRQDYVRTAKAKGLPEETVYYKHALRNALLTHHHHIRISHPGPDRRVHHHGNRLCLARDRTAVLSGRPRKRLSRGDDDPNHIGRAHAHRKFHRRYPLWDCRSPNSISIETMESQKKTFWHYFKKKADGGRRLSSDLDHVSDRGSCFLSRSLRSGKTEVSLKLKASFLPAFISGQTNSEGISSAGCSTDPESLYPWDSSQLAISIFIGVLVGALAGYYGRWVDSLLMRFVDTMLCFPSFFLILTVVALLGPSIFNIMVVIGMTSWMGTSRFVRAEFLSLRERDFTQAARALGVKDSRIIFRHILPNALAPVFVTATLKVASAILIEAGLSFLGFGVQPPAPSWGNILTEGRTYIFDAWWLTVFPGLAILITVLSFNLLGEGLRDALDPRLRGRR